MSSELVRWPYNGRSSHPLYLTYSNMLRRCYYEKNNRFHRYGGRGIKVCDRWLGREGFGNFVVDIGDKPSAKHTLDRINPDGDYSPENCRWATYFEQNTHLSKRTDNSSGHTGVSYDPRSLKNPWRAYISMKGKQFNLGRHKTYEKALDARIAGEKKYFGL